MEPSAIELLNTGGVLAFALMLWRVYDKLVDKLEAQNVILDKMLERLARIDTRTHRADTESETGGEVTQRVRKRTPPPTPMMYSDQGRRKP